VLHLADDSEHLAISLAQAALLECRISSSRRSSPEPWSFVRPAFWRRCRWAELTIGKDLELGISLHRLLVPPLGRVLNKGEHSFSTHERAVDARHLEDMASMRPHDVADHHLARFRRPPRLGHRVAFPCVSRRSGREDRLDGAKDLLGLRKDQRTEPCDNRSFGRDEELLEVPLDLTGLAAGVWDGRELLVERVLPLTIYVDLLGDGEGHAIGQRTERRDLVGRSRLLATELVARDAEDGKATVAIGAMELLKPGILGGQPALGRNVDDEHRPVTQRVEVERLSVERCDLVLENGDDKTLPKVVILRVSLDYRHGVPVHGPWASSRAVEAGTAQARTPASASGSGTSSNLGASEWT